MLKTFVPPEVFKFIDEHSFTDYKVRYLRTCVFGDCYPVMLELLYQDPNIFEIARWVVAYMEAKKKIPLSISTVRAYLAHLKKLLEARGLLSMELVEGHIRKMAGGCNVP